MVYVARVAHLDLDLDLDPHYQLGHRLVDQVGKDLHPFQAYLHRVYPLAVCHRDHQRPDRLWHLLAYRHQAYRLQVCLHLAYPRPVYLP